MTSMRYHIPNHSHSIMSAAGVWQLKPEVSILNGPKAGPHTNNSTLKDASSPRNNGSPQTVPLVQDETQSMIFHHTPRYNNFL